MLTFVLLRFFPDLVIDNPEARRFFDHPFIRWIKPGNALAGIRILGEALAIVDDEADVKLIVQNAAAPQTAAVYRRGIPLTAPWAQNALTVQPRSDAPGASPAPYSSNIRRIIAASVAFTFRSPRATVPSSSRRLTL